mgnify:CR=1 FL=1
MRKNYKWGIALATLLLVAGCGQSPEAMKKNAVKFITAQNIEELVVGSQLQNASYIPGLEQSVRDNFAGECAANGVPMTVPFEELIKKGNFDEVNTDVILKTVQKSTNPLTADDTAFVVTFNGKKKFPDGNQYLLTLQFVVYNSPEGCVIADYIGRIEINGKEDAFKNWKILLVVIGNCAHGNKAVDKFFAENNNQTNNNKTSQGEQK